MSLPFYSRVVSFAASVMEDCDPGWVIREIGPGTMSAIIRL